jgi:hypothetical protein
VPDDQTAEVPIPGLDAELPDYHGKRPRTMTTKLAGTLDWLATPHPVGSKIVAVVELLVASGSHAEDDSGEVTYSETRKILGAYEVPGDPGRRLLSAYRNAYRLADDEATGKIALPEDGGHDGAVGVTDASGVALTPTELAELHGMPADPVRVALDPDATPVVVLFSDGSRELWPEEFDPGEPRPKPGDKWEADTGDGPLAYIYVAKLLHAETGETLGEWTDDQEAARLVELEERLAAEEDGDRAATVTERARTPEPPPMAADDLEPDLDAEDLEPLDPGEPLAPTDVDEEDLVSVLEPEVTYEEDADGYADVVAVAFPPEPDAEDFALVDHTADVVAVLLSEVSDLDRAKRLLEAEKRGRRPSKPLRARKGVLDAIHRRIAELEELEGAGR